MGCLLVKLKVRNGDEIGKKRTKDRDGDAVRQADPYTLDSNHPTGGVSLLHEHYFSRQ